MGHASTKMAASWCPQSVGQRAFNVADNWSASPGPPRSKIGDGRPPTVTFVTREYLLLDGESPALSTKGAAPFCEFCLRYPKHGMRLGQRRQ